LPGWLEALGKLPGFKGETAGKGDGVIVDPATELDPTIKGGTPLTTPSGSGGIDDIFKTPPAKGLVDYLTTMLGENGPQVASKVLSKRVRCPAVIAWQSWEL